MPHQASEAAYRAASFEGITVLGLHKILYEAIALHLQRAGTAIEAGQIGIRCSSSNHALLLLGHLESWAPEWDDPRLASSLGSYYRNLRAQILQGQTQGDKDFFVMLGQQILDLRSAWEQKEQAQPVRSGDPSNSLQAQAPGEQQRSLAWTA